MDFSTALAEFVDLLTVASRALTRIAAHEKAARPEIESQLAEVEAIAARLREIGEKLRPGSSPRQ